MSDGLKSYPAYKDSGVPWLGRIPEHWKISRAKSLFRKMDRPVRDYDEVVTCFRDGVVTLRKNRRVRGFTESLKEIGYQGIRRGDLVIHAMDAFAGAVGVSDSDGKGTPVYSVCEPAPAANSYYYAFTIREMARNKWIQALAKGIRERSTDFRFDDFGTQLVPHPPLAEQTAIVRYLDYVDRRLRRFILSRQKLIKLLEEQKAAIIHRAVTRGLDPNVRLKPSGVAWLGDVPAHWDITPLAMIFQERKEKNDPIKTSEILSLSLTTGVIPYAEKKPGGNKAKEDLSAYMLAYPGDIVLNSMNVVVGSVGLSKYFGAVSPVYYVLHLRSRNDSVEFFDAVFHDLVFQRSLFGLGNGILYIESKSTGKLNTIRLRIPMSKLKRVLLPHPGPKEQSAIVEQLAEKCSLTNRAIAEARREIDLLEVYRSQLIADVVTGRVDVREGSTRLPEETYETELLGEQEITTEIDEEDEEIAENIGEDGAS